MTGYKHNQLATAYEAIKAAGGVGLTHLEIARALGIKKSVYTKKLLQEMVSNGWVIERKSDNEPRAPFRYSIPVT